MQKQFGLVLLLSCHGVPGEDEQIIFTPPSRHSLERILHSFRFRRNWTVDVESDDLPYFCKHAKNDRRFHIFYISSHMWGSIVAKVVDAYQTTNGKVSTAVAKFPFQFSVCLCSLLILGCFYPSSSVDWRTQGLQNSSRFQPLLSK